MNEIFLVEAHDGRIEWKIVCNETRWAYGVADQFFEALYQAYVALMEDFVLDKILTFKVTMIRKDGV